MTRWNVARRDLIVYFANSTWYGPAGTDRHITRALSAHAPVLYVEPPVSMLTALRNPAYARSLAQAPPVEVLDERMARAVTTVAPGMTKRGLHHLTAPMVRRAVRGIVDGLIGPGREPVAALVSCRAKPLWGALPARRRLFYATDDLPAGAALLGEPRERLLRDEARTLRGADVVAVVSPGLRERYAAGGHDAVVVPNGCLPAAYDGVDTAALPDDVDLPGPIAGFVGYLNHRIDVSLLSAVARTGVSLLIVGPVVPGYDISGLVSRPNVRWVGAKDFDELPSYLRLIDVGLTPYADTEFNRASFPLKTLEYLAAGRRVVATPLPANDWLGTDLIAVASGPAEFAARVEREVAAPRDSAPRRAFAQEHTWERRAAVLAGLLGINRPAGTGPGSRSAPRAADG
ncbi:hypothetical protein Val02_14470 [Virgisporangium aliadipatigenens]|uniref:Teichuronic acid biosynthesis glycosyltransferase TuaH n=1 Tax=Virgisporangium aliadipatigenens TaxID=741659 RepID=A0A8J4DP58_9ACTN|nr:glycosyltransferase [Virgisporangium aliadipatigenens]GIJ44561.1 hypothetical protein Val02_14470 [Virgisporangium aliadipatigenens]